MSSSISALSSQTATASILEKNQANNGLNTGNKTGSTSDSVSVSEQARQLAADDSAPKSVSQVLQENGLGERSAEELFVYIDEANAATKASIEAREKTLEEQKKRESLNTSRQESGEVAEDGDSDTTGSAIASYTSKGVGETKTGTGASSLSLSL